MCILLAHYIQSPVLIFVQIYKDIFLTRIMKNILSFICIIYQKGKSFRSEKGELLMKTKLMKIAAAAAAVTVMGGAVPPMYAGAQTAEKTSSSSQTENQKILTDAVTLVRTRIDIPAEYEDFTGNVSKSKNTNVINMTWKKKLSGDSYRVVVEGKTITRVNAPYNYERKPSLAPYTKEQYEQAALRFAEKANPSMKGKLKVRSCSVTITDDTVSVWFDRVQDGIKVANNTVSVSLSKKDMSVSGLNVNWFRNAAFESPEKALSSARIEKIYRDEVTLIPHYRLRYPEDESGVYIADPVYVPDSAPVYDAFTGKHSTMDEDRKKGMNTDNARSTSNKYDEEEVAVEEDGEIAAGEALEFPESYSLTDSEKEQVKALENALSSEQFKAVLMNDPYIDFSDEYYISDFNIFKDDSYDSGYGIRLYAYINNDKNYISLDVNADAMTGKITSFNKYKDNTQKKTAIDVAASNKKASEVIKYYYKGFYKQFKADDENTAPAVKTSTYTESERNFMFNRYENNIIVDNQRLTVRINSAGEVLGVNANYAKKVNFGSKKILSADEALTSYLKENKLSLSYTGFTDLNSKPHTYLVYNPGSFTVDARTGKTYSYGIIYDKEAPDECPFTDIENSPYKNEIKTLFEQGVVYYRESKFAPNKGMTAAELYDLTRYIGLYSYDESRSSDKNITRYDMARHFVNSAGYEDAAKLKGIYRQIFDDIKSSDKRAGTAAIAYSMGVVSPVDGKFEPDREVTREEAYHAIYSYLNSNS